VSLGRLHRGASCGVLRNEPRWLKCRIDHVALLSRLRRRNRILAGDLDFQADRLIPKLGIRSATVRNVTELQRTDSISRATPSAVLSHPCGLTLCSRVRMALGLGCAWSGTALHLYSIPPPTNAIKNAYAFAWCDPREQSAGAPYWSIEWPRWARSSAREFPT
jgi:hypothetical protein